VVGYRLNVADDQGDPRVYLRIAGDLRARIAAGEFTREGRDGKIPSVRTLMQEHGVAYDTAQHAVTTLEAEGLVKRYPGRGYYVTSRA
jgi:DNA-binding GntR family transcriptional regulator